VGGDGFEAPAETNEPSLHEHLAGRYGTEANHVLDLLDDDPELAEPLVPGLPYLRAEAVHAVRHEMARSVDDVLSRRTRARLLARDASAAAADSVAAILAPELGWDAAETQRQADAYRAAIAHARESAQLPETALDASLGA
jgi:glycerol-3-phosphate dehydrogenase